MKRLNWILLVLALGAGLGASAQAQDAPPREPFKTVHLVSLASASDVAALQAALADMNAAVAKSGFPNVSYRLYKVVGKQSGSYNYLWESSWPGGEAYEKIHKSAAWQAAAIKHPQMEALRKVEVYNRYVEVDTKR